MITKNSIRSVGLSPRRLLISVSVSFLVAASAGAQSLFVASPWSSYVTEYDAAVGTQSEVISAGMNGPVGLAVSGNTLFVANGGGSSNGGYITEYNATTGAQLGTITTAGELGALAISGNTLFVANNSPGGVMIMEYNSTTGAQLGTTISFGSSIGGLAVFGNTIFASNPMNSAVMEYNATTGAQLGTITTGISDCNGLAISGNTLFVANTNTSGVTEYNATTGAQIGTTITIPAGLIHPASLAIYGNILFISAGNNSNSTTVTEYDATTGIQIGTTISESVPDGGGAGIVAVPESSTYGLIGAGSFVAAVAVRRRRKAQAVGVSRR